MLELILTTAPAASKNDTRFKSGKIDMKIIISSGSLNPGHPQYRISKNLIYRSVTKSCRSILIKTFTFFFNLFEKIVSLHIVTFKSKVVILI